MGIQSMTETYSESFIDTAEVAPVVQLTPIESILIEAIAIQSAEFGTRVAVREIVSGNVQLCVLAEDIEKKEVVELLLGLCKAHNVPVHRYSSRLALSESCRFGKVNEDDERRRACPHSVCVIKNFGKEESTAQQLIGALKA